MSSRLSRDLEPATREITLSRSGRAIESVVRSCVREGLMCYIEASTGDEMSGSERRAAKRQPRRRRDDVGASREETTSPTTLDADGWGKPRGAARRGVIQRKSPVRHVGVGPETAQDLP